MDISGLCEEVVEITAVEHEVTEKEESLIEMRVAAEYIKVSEKYRAGITLEADKDKIIELALTCITELTGDFVFYEQNMKKLGLG